MGKGLGSIPGLEVWGSWPRGGESPEGDSQATCCVTWACPVPPIGSHPYCKGIGRLLPSAFPVLAPPQLRKVQGSIVGPVLPLRAALGL